MVRQVEEVKVRGKLKEHRQNIWKCKTEIEEINRQLKETLTEEEFKTVERAAIQSERTEYEKVRRSQTRKFDIIMQTKKQEQEEQKKIKEDQERMRKELIKKDFVDLTKNGIDPEIKAYLALGPDFCESPHRIPFELIIAETEKMCTDIRKALEEKTVDERIIEMETQELREKTRKLLEKERGKKLKSNLTKEEKSGKIKARKDKDRVYLPADKGRIMVAMDKYEQENGENSYEHKMKKVLEDLKAKPSIRANEDWDLTEKVSRDGVKIINAIIEKGEINKEAGKMIQPKDCRSPRLSGYPKIHKDGVPLRGVVSFIESPFEKASKLLVPILKTLQGRSGMYVKNSRELKSKIENWRLERDEILVSFDVKNLYPSIPIQEALDLVENLLMSKPNLQEVTSLSVGSIMDLLKWIFGLTYCEFEGKHYVLESGPIGLGVTGEIAIIYMEEFILSVQKSCPYPLKEWYWYVDDSEVICKAKNTGKILEYLNNVKPGILVFTKEEQEDETLSVLDLKQIVDRKTKRLKFSIHYKTTHTNINVHARSNHPEYMKKAIVKGFAERAKQLCDEDSVEEEIRNIENVFVANGYERSKIKEYIKPRKLQENNTDDNEEPEIYGRITIPYIKGFAEKFRKIARDHSFSVSFKPGNKVKDLKSCCRESIGLKKREVVYSIPCKCGTGTYTGETWRRADIRIKEHEGKVRRTLKDIEEGNMESAEKRMESEDGGLAKHRTSCDKQIDWNNVKILCQQTGTRKRKVREGIESLRQKYHGLEQFNSYEHLESWKPLLDTYFEIDRGPCRS